VNIALWIAQAALAFVFSVSGVFKISLAKDALVAKGQTGVAFFPTAFIRFVALSELLAVAGLLGPGLTGVAEYLTPLAAALDHHGERHILPRSARRRLGRRGAAPQGVLQRGHHCLDLARVPVRRRWTRDGAVRRRDGLHMIPEHTHVDRDHRFIGTARAAAAVLRREQAARWT
jgi:hypothetical protein